MTLTEVYDIIYNELSGGKKVKLEVDASVITGAVDRAFKKVRQWYFEPKQAETVSKYGTGSQEYLLKSDLTRTVRRIYKLYNTSHIRSAAGSIDSMLYGIDNVLLNTSGLVEQAYYVEFATSLEQFDSQTLDFMETTDKILLSGDYDSEVTVMYSPQPVSVAEVTVQKALDWLIAYSISLVSISLGRVRSKFRGGDMDVQMDGEDLVSQGREDKTTLEEKLSTLDFRI
jgi:hypothetical protein